MTIKILLIISILLQLLATVVAIRMIRETKYNSVWILFIIVLSLMTASRILQCAHYVPSGETSPWFIAIIWISIATSLCITIALFYSHKLVKYIDRLIFQKQLTSKRILSTVLRTEEKERIRFSKELHDGLGPLLSSAGMSLSALSKSGQTEGNIEILENTSYVIQEAIRSLREISNNLSPHVLNEFGLGRGVGNFITRCAAMHDVKIEYTSALGNERFDADVEVILYRVICELINNSLKHSGATAIRLELSCKEGSLVIDYSDNGCGFDPVEGSGSGMGLSNIASRINTLNGTLDIASAKGEGMKATIKVELNRDNGK
jgi:signal transduction histidine kinase